MIEPTESHTYDDEGIYLPAEGWPPDRPNPSGVPAAMESRAECQLEGNGRYHFTVNGRVVWQSWFPKGTKGGISVTLDNPPPPPPPPPVVVTLASLTLVKSSLKPGESTTGTVTLSGPVAQLTSVPVRGGGFEAFAWIEPQGNSGVFSVFVPQGTSPQLVALKASYGGVERTANLQIEAVVPPPTNVVNVMDCGAKPDGVTDNRQAFNTALGRVPSVGGTVFVPAGTYAFPDRVPVNRNGVCFRGEGDASILHNRVNCSLMLGTNGQPYKDQEVCHLQFLGNPGRYMQDGVNGGGVWSYGSKGAFIHHCLFTGCIKGIEAQGVPGTTAGVIIEDCRWQGWGAVAIFCNGGERIRRCLISQDDPNLYGERSSHGIYVHSGASDVAVEDCTIENVRKYAIQYYGQDPGTFIADCVFRRNVIRNCANGITLQQSAPDRARVRNLLIEDCVMENIYGSSGAFTIKQGDGITIQRCEVKGVARGAGVALGVWAPYEPNFYVTDLIVRDCDFSGCAKGSFWAMGSQGGTFRNVVLGPNNQPNTVVREGNTEGVQVL